MTDSVEQQAAKVLDEAVARRDRTLPTWASARLTRIFRGVDGDERAGVVERLCDRPNVPASLADDIRRAADRASNPAPAPPPPPPPPQPSRRAASGQPRERTRRTTPAATRGVRTGSFKARNLNDVPAGVEVEYQGRRATVEPPLLVLEDGRKFQFLNPAAAYVNGGIDVNGWDAWRVLDGRSIGECYDSGDWPASDSA